MEQQGNLNRVGNPDAPILVITDAPGKHAYDTGQVMSAHQMKVLQRYSQENGIPGNQFRIITPCPPIPDDISSSEKKIGAFLASYREEFVQEITSHTEAVRLVVTLGKVALRQLMGKQVRITEARGTLTQCDALPGIPVLPLLSPANILRRPEMQPIFEGDFRQIASLRDSGWEASIFDNITEKSEYEWCLDLKPLLNKRPTAIALDTETRGLEWRNGRKAVICVQITTRPGHAYVVPLDKEYFNDETLRGDYSKTLPKLTDKLIEKLIGQIRELLADPNVRVVGHNLKYDIHHLLNYGITVANWYADTMQLAFCVDENMQIKSLDECTRRWVKGLAGYADTFNSETDKANMHLVPHDKMLRYSGGDTDATYQLMTELKKEAAKDAKNFNCFHRVQMPAVRAFVSMERAGIRMNKNALRDLGVLFKKTEKQLYAELIALAVKKSPTLCRKFADTPDGLKFTANFLIELLFSDEGFKLTPRVWTPGTKKLPQEQRIPSTSCNTHLPFFSHIGFVAKLIDYKKLQKMRTSYVGHEGGLVYAPIKRLKNGKLPLAVERILIADKSSFTEAEYKSAFTIRKPIAVTAPVAYPKDVPVRRRSITAPADADKPAAGKPKPVAPFKTSGRITIDANGEVWKTTLAEPTGFWQHLIGGDIMHPFFRLDNTVTGRSSSNLQNIPKRDPVMAKAFRKCFIPKVNPVTGVSNVFVECDLSQAELRIMAWASNEKNMIRIYNKNGDIHITTAAGVKGIAPADVTKADRQGAKAVNFGLIYLMWWRSLIDYAKTTYQVTMTPTQAEAAYKGFFAMYPAIAAYHKATVNFVKENTYVRALHGALRRLPSINSDDEGIRKECERQSVNSPIQRFASDIGLMGLARFLRDCPTDRMWPVAFIHDAVVIECVPEAAEEAASAIRFYMQSIPFPKWFDITPPLPITADASIGADLAAMEERPDIEAKQPEWFREELDFA
jgi:uracil-DNA glycosylase family 4